MWVKTKDRHEAHQIISVNMTFNPKKERYEIWGTRPNNHSFMMDFEKDEEKATRIFEMVLYALEEGIALVEM